MPPRHRCRDVPHSRPGSAPRESARRVCGQRSGIGRRLTVLRRNDDRRRSSQPGGGADTGVLSATTTTRPVVVWAPRSSRGLRRRTRGLPPVCDSLGLGRSGHVSGCRSGSYPMGVSRPRRSCRVAPVNSTVAAPQARVPRRRGVTRCEGGSRVPGVGPPADSAPQASAGWRPPAFPGPGRAPGPRARGTARRGAGTAAPR